MGWFLGNMVGSPSSREMAHREQTDIKGLVRPRIGVDGAGNHEL